MDLMEQGAAWLASQRAKCASRAVTYSRGDKSVMLAAAMGRTSFDIESTYGVAHFESRDFLVCSPRVGWRW